MKQSIKKSPSEIIRQYRKDVIAWHGFVRFLGLPTLQNNPDVPLDELYVAQSLSADYLSTEEAPEESKLLNPINHLLAKKQLVVLGDPGSGKSTLINWFSWYLASGFSNKLPAPIGDLLPVTLVLRDLDLSKVVEHEIETLLAAFVARPVADVFQGDTSLLLNYMTQGKVLLLIDGLDEVSPKYRNVVKTLLTNYIKQFPDNYVICTSRIVGYEIEQHKDLIDVININDAMLTSSQLNACYLAPFTVQQVSQFALNWYRDNLSGNDKTASLLRDDFIDAISNNPSTEQLARTPHLLTMMALIYKIKSQLPNGRALLYDLIAQAYLESIDTARKLQDKFLWQDKKRWLAHIGFEMQLKRVKLKEKEQQNLLVEKKEILRWIKSAMLASGNQEVINDSEYAAGFLDWIARRSGLLLPRGEDQFAFLHLSFQEYFAAVYIQQQVENPEWLDRSEPDEDEESTLDSRFKENKLQDWVNEESWQQTIILLFELMASKPGWAKRLWKECFKDEAVEKQKSRWLNSNMVDDKLHSLIEEPIGSQFFLRTQLLGNPHSGITGAFYQRAFLKLLGLNLFYHNWVYEIDPGYVYIAQKSIDQLSVLFRLKEGKKCWKQYSAYADEIRMVALTGLDESTVSDVLSYIVKFRYLKALILNGCESLSLNKIYHLHELSYLGFISMKKINIASLQSLEKLTRITILLGDDSLKGIEKADKLLSLSIMHSGVNDLTPLKKLTKLESLQIFSSPVDDISPLAALTNLKYLGLHDTKVKDLKPISHLKIKINGNITQDK